jgi:cytoskeletal protein RodZ
VSQPVAKPPVELPRPPVVAEKTPVAPPAPKKTSPVLVIVLILVVLGVGGFLVWKYVLQNDASPSASNTPATAPVAPPAPTPPPAPVAPTAKIALVAPPADEIKVGKAGTVENILAQTQVKAGDALVRLVGDRPLEAQLDTLRKELGKLRDQLDAATKKRDAATPATKTAADVDVAARQKALDAKQAQISTKQGDLDALVISAPADGAFSPSAQNNQKVAAGDVVAKLQRDAVPSVTFRVPDPKVFSATAPVVVMAKDQKLGCTVAEVGTDSTVKVTCPADPTLVDGAEVTLALPGAGQAPPPAAAGSDAPQVGSSDPAAGSAK